MRTYVLIYGYTRILVLIFGVGKGYFLSMVENTTGQQVCQGITDRCITSSSWSKCAFMYVCIYLCIYVCMYACTYVRMYYVCIYVCIYVCTYVCMCML